MRTSPRAIRSLTGLLVVIGVSSACADKAPPALWPDPPPPTLATPIEAPESAGVPAQESEPGAEARDPEADAEESAEPSGGAEDPETNDPEEGAVRIDGGGHS